MSARAMKEKTNGLGKEIKTLGKLQSIKRE